MAKAKVKDCPTCYGPCDPEIHAATARIHDWLHDRLMAILKPVDIPVPEPKKLAPDSKTIGLIPKKGRKKRENTSVGD